MYSFKTTALITLLIAFATTASSISNCNCVAFRMDDIQDWWLVDAQTGLIDIFKAQKIPLTVGIIANSYGQDSTITQKIKESIQVPGWDFEVASHGWNHEAFETFSLQDQIELLTESKNKILSSLPDLEDVPTFIAPFNSFNDDTLTALEQTGYQTFSSMVQLDSPPYPKSNADLYRWPIGASTADFAYDDVYFLGVDHEVTFAQILQQLQNNGFAAVMMHPQEFSVLDQNNNPTEVPSAHMMSELALLIQKVQDAGIQFVTLGGMDEAFAGTYDPTTHDSNAADDSDSSSTTSPSTPSSTTGKKVTTGSVTTGNNQGSGSSTTTGAQPATTHAPTIVTTGTQLPATTSSVTTGVEEITSGNEITSGIEITSGSEITSGREVTSGNEITSGIEITSGVQITSGHEITSGSSITSGDITTGEDCVRGSENCICNEDNSCNTGFECSFGLCVDASAESSCASFVSVFSSLVLALFISAGF